MAPVFSRLNPAPLPHEVLRMIASLLPVGALKSFMGANKTFHAVGAPVLYQFVETWFVPVPFYTNVTCIDNRPVVFLESLIKGTLPRTTRSIPSRCYATYVVTLCYGSWSSQCDFRALPLLAEALRYTHRLRHLRIDVGSGSVPLLLDVFRRASIIVPPSTMLATSGLFVHCPLPCLRSIRVCRIAIAEALMQHRAIETVVVELGVKEEALATFLRLGAPWDPRHLRQLSLNIVGYPSPPQLLGNILLAFPELQHLALRMTSVRAPEYTEDALAILIDLPDVGKSLHTLSMNHGIFHSHLAPSLEHLHSIFEGGFRHRPALKVVVMGGSLWARKDIYSQWSFTAFKDTYLSHWPWLQYPSEGELGAVGVAVKAYYHEI